MRQANSPRFGPTNAGFARSRPLAIVALLAVATVAPLAPPSILPGWPKCLLRNATGLPCPFRGGTRAAQSLLRGDFSQALYLNAIAFPVVFAVIAVAAVLAGRRGGHDHSATGRPCFAEFVRSFRPYAC